MFLGMGVDVLGDPGRRLAGRAQERLAEDAGGAREDEGADTRRDRLLEQIEGAGDVGVDEFLPAVGHDMGLVQGGGVDDRLHSRRASGDEIPVDDRSDMGREGRVDDVDGHDIVPGVPQRPDQRLAEMTGTPGDQNSHALD